MYTSNVQIPVSPLSLKRKGLTAKKSYIVASYPIHWIKYGGNVNSRGYLTLYKNPTHYSLVATNGKKDAARIPITVVDRIIKELKKRIVINISTIQRKKLLMDFEKGLTGRIQMFKFKYNPKGGYSNEYLKMRAEQKSLSPPEAKELKYRLKTGAFKFK